MHTGKKGITDLQVAEMAGLYDDGQSLRQIAPLYNVSFLTVHYHLRKLHQQFRPSGGAPGRGRPPRKNPPILKGAQS